MRSRSETTGATARMDRSRIAAELRYLAWVNPIWVIEYAWGRSLLRGLTTLMPPLPIRGVTVDVVKGAPPLRVYRPKTQRTGAALLFIHGGGFVMGSPRTADFRCGAICRELGMTVVAVGPRLAPENPFPLPSDDCLAAWHWLQSQAAALGVDPARVAIGGVSAGGALAAGLVQRIRDAGGMQPVAQWLLAPMLDDRTAARRELDGIMHPVWNNRLNRTGWRSFLGQEPGSDDVPAYAAPGRRENLSGLPTTFISIGDIDLLYEENRQYADRLRQHGVSVTFDILRGAPHGFEEIARRSSMAKAYMLRAREWLRDAVEG